MKNQIAHFVLVAIVAASSVTAQGPGRFQRDGGPGDAAQNSADAIARRVEFLTALLTLTNAQASQATTIFTSAAATITPVQSSLSAARTSLRAAVVANNTGQIDQLSTQIGASTAQMTAAHNKAEAAFYALLTAEQRTRYEAVGHRGGGDRGR